MPSKIKRTQCFQQYPKFPWCIPYREKYIFPQVYRQYIITIHSKTAKSHAKNIGAALKLLLQHMGIDKLIFLGDSTIPWLFRCDKHDYYNAVQEAFAYLKANKVGKSFNGGLMVETAEVAEFAKHLFWLTRSNGIVQYVYGMDERQQILLQVCQHGNIHFNTFDETTDKLFQEVLSSTGLHLLDGDVCYEPFSKSGRIPHRTITV